MSQMTNPWLATLQTVALGIDSFATLRTENLFYVDKTSLIREWWEAGDDVTLISRPRRFGKTLTMSMLECFFSTLYKGRSDLFEGLQIWNYQKFRELQGTFPVIHLSFAGVKGPTFASAIYRICTILDELLSNHQHLLTQKFFSEEDRTSFKALRNRIINLDASSASAAIHCLSTIMARAEQKQVIILLDEYDAPLHEAWVNGYWEEMSSFMQSLLIFTFKTNTSLERGLLTGVVRVNMESIFSGFNNLRIASVLTEGRYETSLGFTEEEVSEIMKSNKISDADAKEMKEMYAGFVFGSQKGIYNPWSVMSYLSSKRELNPCWANTSSNQVIERLIQTGSENLQSQFASLLQGEAISSELNEQIVFSQLENSPDDFWSLLVAAGYLTPEQREASEYKLVITNGEAYMRLERLILAWFEDAQDSRDEFTKAMLDGNIASMNRLMENIAQACFSVFQFAFDPSQDQAERFYHGFLLALRIDLGDRYYFSFNRGIWDEDYAVIIEPRDKKKDDAFILAFKLIEPDQEDKLIQIVEAALAKIEKKQYAAKLVDKEIPLERIHKYAFAFSGKKILIDDESEQGRRAYRAKHDSTKSLKKNFL